MAVDEFMSASRWSLRFTEEIARRTLERSLLQSSKTSNTPNGTFPGSQPVGGTSSGGNDPTGSDGGSGSNSNTGLLIGLVVMIVLIVAALLGYLFLRTYRRKHPNPKFIPTSFLKEKWSNWTVGHRRIKESSRNHLEPITNRNVQSTDATLLSAPTGFDASSPSTQALEGQNSTNGVDRNTSVRSVMTLPAYHPNPRQNEQVLGREGERGGVDIVLEFPEQVAEAEEAVREEEMEALYQVRLARRNEMAEREERTRLRAELVERGDWVALRELNSHTRGRPSAASQAVEAARAERDRVRVEAEGRRSRAVSSVSYADLGVARHDGTRLRANSGESERMGLLGDAASIAAGSSRHHQRERSAGSVLSIDTNTGSDLDHPSPGFARDRRGSRPESPLRRISAGAGSSLSVGGSQGGGAMSSPELVDMEREMGDTESEDFPVYSPPGYDNVSLDDSQDRPDSFGDQGQPPDYTSPIDRNGPDLTTTDDISSIAESQNENRPRRQSRRQPDQRHSRRGVGGVPQLPSLRLGSLPSIVLDSGSPIEGRRTNEND